MSIALHGHGQGDEGVGSGRSAKPKEFAAMQEYNEELVKAGILLAAEGLAASSKGEGQAQKNTLDSSKALPWGIVVNTYKPAGPLQHLK